MDEIILKSFLRMLTLMLYINLNNIINIFENNLDY